MQTLNTIQKTFRVFQILAKIALIFCIVGASFCALGVLCVSVWRAGGQVFSILGDPILFHAGSEDMAGNQAVLLADLIFLTADAILLGLAGRYFKIEQAEGTPFTENGAALIRNLGIHCIWIPIVAVVLASVVTTYQGVERSVDAGSLPGVSCGIVLILASLIFRYGAELEPGKRATASDGEK